MSLPNLQAAIALNRFGLGARPDETLPADPKHWLTEQLDRYDPRPATLVTLGDGQALAKRYREAAKQRRMARMDSVGLAARSGMPIRSGGSAAMSAGELPMTMPSRDGAAGRGLAASPMPDGTADPLAPLRAEMHDRYRAAINARMAVALTTPTPFPERLVAFWSNHFAISIEKPEVQILAPDYEAEAIRPHVMGRFADMLLAVEHHPAMLTYLDQDHSTGPNSPRAQRVAMRAPGGKVPGLNENLAREIMELHTLGVRTGYGQADVIEFARALTGWSVAGLNPNEEDAPVAFRFRPEVHEPGSRTIIGRAYPQGGEDQARAVLLDLAASPATARHIATKLARHFVADDPPPALVERLTASYLKSDGDLPALYRTLIGSPEAWAAALPKFKSPWDWTVSGLRGLGRSDAGRMDAAAMLNQLGEQVWKPGQPVGYDDTAAAWAAPDALMRRVELAQRFAAAYGPELDARMLAPKLLPGTLSPTTAAQLAQAESGPTALALLLVSPEFQRR